MGIQLENFINEDNMELSRKEIRSFLQDFFKVTEIKKNEYTSFHVDQTEKLEFNTFSKSTNLVQSKLTNEPFSSFKKIDKNVNSYFLAA